MFSSEIFNNSRKIKFVFFEKLLKIEKTHLILTPNDINYYINKYNIENPKYKKGDNYYSINSINEKDIFDNLDIFEILDGTGGDIPSIEIFKKYNERSFNDISNLYILDNYDNNCKNIFNNKYKKTIKRNELENKINNFIKSEHPILFLTGPEKTGKSITIIKSLINSSKKFLYLDISIIYKLPKNEKKKYIFLELLRLFNYYKEYTFIINKYFNIFENTDNIIQFTKNLIQEFIINEIKNTIVLVLDNYDDLYTHEAFSNTFISYLNIILKKIKLILCGNGKFFNYLINQYFSGKIVL